MGVWLCSALLIIALSVWSRKVVYSAPCVFDMKVSSGRRVISYDSSLNASSCRDTEGCSCVITAPPGHHIRLKFYTFQLSDFMSSGWQVNDWLNVYDGNTTNADDLLGKFTGTMRPFTVQSSSRFIMVMLNRDGLYPRCTFEGVYTYSTTKDKPKIKIPSQVVRTVPGHVLWCSAEGSPPINISLSKDSATLDNDIGKVTSKIYKEGIYTCLARNEVGSDSREIRVTFVDCENACSNNDGKVVDGQIENDYGCIKTGSSIDIFQCLPTTATTLNLQQNEISTFSSDAFEDLKELHELNLQRNRIQNLSANAFSSLTALQHLNLASNKIQYLPTGIFSKLTNLRQLILASNSIRNLSPGIFSKQLNLGILNMASNEIRHLPLRVFSKLSNLMLLKLASNKIGNLPTGIFSNLLNLDTLDLKHNEIELLPEGIFHKLSLLEQLSLEWNKIANLTPGIFSKLSKLQILCVH